MRRLFEFGADLAAFLVFWPLVAADALFDRAMAEFADDELEEA